MYHFDEAALLDDSTVSSIVGNAFLRVNEGEANIEGGQAYVEDIMTDPETSMVGDDVTLLDGLPLWPGDLKTMAVGKVPDNDLTNAGLGWRR